MQLVYSFPELVTGKLLKRYKRFFADIELDNGQVITAHCANTGPMTGVSEAGSLVAVAYQPSPKRKLDYSWEMICISGTWVGINTALPNKVVSKMLADKLIPELGNYDAVKSEVVFGAESSRVDFLLVYSGHKTFVEVKNTTWSLGSTAIFPDTVTTRGQKHLRELMAMVDQGYAAVILYFINRQDCDRFRAGVEVDRDYAILLKQAIAKGVQVLPCRFALDLSGIYYLGQADFISALA